MKRVLIDVNSVVPYLNTGRIHGVGRSTYELVSTLSSLKHLPFEIILYSQNMRGIGSRHFCGTCQTSHFYWPNRPFWKRLLYLTHAQRVLTKYNLIHIPHNTDLSDNYSRTLYTIHDLIVYRYPEFWGLTNREKQFHNYIANESKGIVTCSVASKADIIHFWRIPEEKVSVIPWGVNRHMFYPENNDNYLKSLKIENQAYFFSSVCNHQRKRPELMLEAFNQYRKRGGKNKLVLLSPTPSAIPAYGRYLEDHSLVIVDSISDEQLRVLYSQAKATLVTSCFEGFGLPILESLACGTNVISSKNSSLVEAGGSVIDYLERDTPGELADKLLHYERTSKERTLNQEKNQQHLLNFTWERCAELYVKLYQGLLET